MQSSLISSTYTHRHNVGYSETDQMGFMHHSNYARVYENARWEYFRELGIPYKSVEETGILMPVIEMDLKYIKPILYDDTIIVKVRISKCSGAKICFEYAITNSFNEIVNKANISLAFVDKISGKAIRIPEFIYNKIFLN